MNAKLARLETRQESVGLSLALLSGLVDLSHDLAGGLLGSLELLRTSLLGLVDHFLKVLLVRNLADQHVNHVLLVLWQLLLELLGESLPVDILDVSFRFFDLLLDLFSDSLDILTADLLHFVDDTLEVLVLQVGKESVLVSNGREELEGSGGEESFGELSGAVTLAVRCCQSSGMMPLTSSEAPPWAVLIAELAAIATSATGLTM